MIFNFSSLVGRTEDPNRIVAKNADKLLFILTVGKTEEEPDYEMVHL